MSITNELVVLDSRYQSAATCLVCGNAIEPGEGVTARYEGLIVRFKCGGCLSRFEADPHRYLAGHQASCCGKERAESPASEWCD